MNTQTLKSVKSSDYRAPEMHELGTLDKVQGYGNYIWDFFYGYYYLLF